MAQGDLILFNEFTQNIGNGTIDLTDATHVFRVMLITEQVGGAPTIAADDLSPDSTDYTEVPTGNGYTTPGEIITCTWTHVAGTTTFAVSSGATVWTQNGAGPTTIKTALIYDADVTATEDAIGYIDMTTDGTTAISLQDGDITITWNPTIFTLS